MATPIHLAGQAALDRALWILVLALAAASATGQPQGDAVSGVLSLEGTWKLRAGDDPGWAAPSLDDSDWRRVSVPTRRGLRYDRASDLVWYRLTVELEPALRPAERPDLVLGLALGKVDSAYEIYAGGLLLGGVGELPPAPRAFYDRRQIFHVPAAAVDSDGRLALALRVWKAPFRRGDVGTLYAGPFLLGPHQELVRRELFSELAELFLAALLVVTGLFHLQIYLRRPELREYLWFFVLTASAGTYSFLLTQWKYALSDRFAAMKELEHLMLYVMSALLIQVLWQLLGAPIQATLRLLQGSLLTAGFLVALTPGLALNARLHSLWMTVSTGIIAASLWQVARGLRRGRPEAPVVALGLTASSLIYLNDLAGYRGWIATPTLAPYGFGIFVLTMGFSFADRFIKILKERERFIDERERFLGEREELIAELRHRNAELVQFNYTVSHDLKNPLLTIKNFVGSLLRDVAEGGSDRIRRDLERVDRAAAHMYRLVEDILAYSRIGRQANPPQAVAFGELVREAEELLAGPIAERGVEIEVAPDLPVVFGDRTRLLELALNLLDNAVKYLGDQPRPRVEVGCSSHGKETALYVRDNGIGIEKRHQGRIFALFDRLAADTDGTGIGLALAQRIVEVHGGRIWVESEGAGQGSTFHFTLPGGEGWTIPGSDSPPSR